jgi:2-oxoglutarate dehydrogenase E1 component
VDVQVLMDSWNEITGPNQGYLLELYERFRQEPASVDPKTRAFFERNGAPSAAAAAPTAPSTGAAAVDVQKVVAVARLARSIREYGHLAASIDPLARPRPGDPMIEAATHGLTDADLQALPGSIVFPKEGDAARSALEAIRRLRAIYSGPIGYDFDHVQDYDERQWLHGTVEEAGVPRLAPEEQRELLERLTRVEAFERYLHTTFPGQKRFSIEGNDVLIPMLDSLVQHSIEHGVREITMGMAHRGRLNVLAHVLGKPYVTILSKFHSPATRGDSAGEAEEVITPGWSGDVKYHLGGRARLDGDLDAIEITLADNPSHLEFVDPVVEGFARAVQDIRNHPGPPTQDVSRALAVTVHGDSAFPGEGIVAETLNLSRLQGYDVGGSIRFIVNNQIGFTAEASESRSTLYASDLAKGFEIPIVHVNADDPEAAIWTVELAEQYRTRFHKDFLIDLVGYRRWGHNEGDEPSYTQPVMYEQIASHTAVRELYARKLIDEGVVSEEEAQRMLDDVREELRRAREESENGGGVQSLPSAQRPSAIEDIRTAVSADLLRSYNEALLTYPTDFTVNRKLARVLERRKTALNGERAVDWGLAESLAFASILADGTPVRLSGQDTQRGTFSHRHAILVDPQTGAKLSPLAQLPQARASFAVYNSPLTEAATLGFEYGYSVHAPEALVLWEAQFGDFANVAQVVIDQFIYSARAKWQQMPALVLLLPHGYEGQGPEHSSARMERYLQLAGEENVRIADVTTAAQYFHVLRLQAATLTGDRRPLILFTPKSLLRHPRSASSIDNLAEGSFQPVLDDPRQPRPEQVQRIVFVTGKAGVDLLDARVGDETRDQVAVVRLELLFPFPTRDVRHVLERYPSATEFVWLQEEPRNMGAWSYIESRMRDMLPHGASLRYIGRPERASTAEGLATSHAREQARILSEAYDLTGEMTEKEERGVQHVG